MVEFHGADSAAAAHAAAAVRLDADAAVLLGERALHAGVPRVLLDHVCGTYTFEVSEFFVQSIGRFEEFRTRRAGYPSARAAYHAARGASGLGTVRGNDIAANMSGRT